MRLFQGTRPADGLLGFYFAPAWLKHRLHVLSSSHVSFFSLMVSIASLSTGHSQGSPYHIATTL